MSTLEQRTPPGSRRAFSSLTVGVDTAASTPPGARGRIIALLRRARDGGVTSFDVADAQYPAAAERLLGEAFPEPDDRLGVIVGRSAETISRASSSGAEGESPATIESALDRTLGESRRRLGNVPILAVEWMPETGGKVPVRGSTNTIPPTWPQDGTILRILRSPRPPEGVETSQPQLLSVDFSLLDLRQARVAPEVPGERVGLVVRNPFADGRLDGSRFVAEGGLRPPGMGPVNLRQLHDEYDPVLRLGFLTRERGRTLAQAALRFVLGWPGVTTAVIPLPAPERLDEVLAFAETPELSPGELSRLGLVK